MNETNKLDVLRAAWQQQGASLPPGLRARVARETRRIRLNTAAELLIVAVFLGGSLWQAVANPAPEFIVLAIGVWMVALVALFYSLSNRAGTWRPATEDTQEFLRISLRRGRASLRGITFGLYLLLVETILLVAWHAWFWSGHADRPGTGVWLMAACVPLAFLIGLLILRARQRKELARLQSLKQELFG